MSDLRKLLGLGDDVKLTKGEKQLADLIEQQQARIAECERLHRELATSLRHDAESPSLCDLVAVARAVANERDELAETVDRFNSIMADIRAECDCGGEFDDDPIPSVLWDLYRETPRQNLNHVKREVAISAALTACRNVADARFDESDFMDFATQYANQRYPDKE